MSRVSVIVPARNAQETLAATLDALRAQDSGEAFEVLVVDDASRDATAAVAERHPLVPKVLRRRGKGHGPGGARNTGVAAASGPLLAFTDADCAPEPGWLRAGVAALDAADLVQGRVVAAPGRPVGPFDRTVSVQAETGLYETASLFTSVAWFERVGGFEDWAPELHGRGFGEDTVFAWTARRAGARTAFCPEAVVRHAVLPGGPRTLFAERARLRLFPALVSRVPELRRAALHRRVFLSPRTAAFDLAALGVGVALARRAPLALLAAAPYARRLAPARRAAPVLLAADVVGAASLLRGSLAARTVVL